MIPFFFAIPQSWMISYFIDAGAIFRFYLQHASQQMTGCYSLFIGQISVLLLVPTRKATIRVL